MYKRENSLGRQMLAAWAILLLTVVGLNGYTKVMGLSQSRPSQDRKDCAGRLVPLETQQDRGTATETRKHYRPNE